MELGRGCPEKTNPSSHLPSLTCSPGPHTHPCVSLFLPRYPSHTLPRTLSVCIICKEVLPSLRAFMPARLSRLISDGHTPLPIPVCVKLLSPQGFPVPQSHTHISTHTHTHSHIFRLVPSCPYTLFLSWRALAQLFFLCLPGWEGPSLP